MPSALETIAACPLFASLSDKDRLRLAQELRERRFASGETITSQDSGGIAFFLLAEGTVSVTVDDEVKASMGSGDYFGEIGLLTGSERSAAIIADGEVQCWTLSQWHFKPLVMEHAEVAWGLLEKLARQVASANA